MEFYEYFLSYEDYFWQWEDDREVLAIPGGNTIAYKDFVLDIFKKLHLQGVPPFGSLLLAITATNPSGKNDIDGIYSMMRTKAPDSTSSLSLNNAVSFLHMLTELPAAYKQCSRRVLLMQAIFENCHNIASPKNSLEIYNSYLTTAYLSGNVAAKKPFSRSNFQKDFKTLEILNNRFKSVQDILEKMASLPEIDEPIILPYSEPQKTDEPLDLIDQLIENEKTFHTGSLVKRIRSGLNIPMHSALPSEQPVGGVSDLTNKGDFDKLLISEFANDDIVFLSRLANNEALYIRREVPPVNNNLERVFLIDSSLRNWGTPKHISFAIMLAIAKHPKTDIASSTYVLGKSFHPVSVENIHTIIDGMQILEGSTDASEGLHAFFKEFPANKNREVFFISESSNFKKPQMMKALVDHHAGIHYWIQTDAEGGIDIYKKQQQSKRHVQRLLLPLEELWKKEQKRKAGTIVKAIEATKYPILFPFSTKTKRILTTENGEIFHLTKSKQLFRFFDKTVKSWERGWQLIHENLPFRGAESGIGLLDNGEYLLFMLNTGSREFKLINLCTNEIKTGHFEFWKGQANSGFFFFDQKFHHRNHLGHWTINSTGVVEKTETLFDAKLAEQRKELLEVSKRFSYSLSVLRNIKKVFINENDFIVLNKHQLNQYNNSSIYFEDGGSKHITREAAKINDTQFSFADGSIVEINPGGLIVLKSSNQQIPAIYIPTAIDSHIGCATESCFTGNLFYLPEQECSLILDSKGSHTLKVIKVVKEELSIGLGEAKHIVDSGSGTFICSCGKAKAYELKAKIEEAGGTVEVRESSNIFGSYEDQIIIKPGEFYKDYIQPFIKHILLHGTKN